VQGKALPLEYRDHPLKGGFKGCRDCNIALDWLLIYRLNDEALYRERTGAHVSSACSAPCRGYRQGAPDCQQQHYNYETQSGGPFKITRR